MAISLNKYVQEPLEASTEWNRVAALADELHQHLSTDDAQARHRRRESARLQQRQNPDMSPRKEFVTVARRMERFFVPGNYTNVMGLCLFGY